MVDLSKIKAWTLTSRGEKRFHLGHPWIYSNELAHSPKGIQNGELVKVIGSTGQLLAYGFGHTSSLIAVRILSRDLKIQNPLHESELVKKLKSAIRLRNSLGIDQQSYRLFFSEADLIPGLIIDRYKLASSAKFIDVIQFQSSGVDFYKDLFLSAISQISEIAILKNDSASRLRDGLESQKAVLVHGVLEPTQEIIHGTTLNGVWIEAGFESSRFFVDFYSGQKTGFFLDQSQNLRTAFMLTNDINTINSAGPTKINALDLFCYQGQWSQMLALIALKCRKPIHIVLVDASQEALHRSELGLLSLAQRFPELKLTYDLIKKDLIKELPELKQKSFDWVICDPPSLIKNRKDISQGTRAYVKLNQSALKLLAPMGRFVSCSCSGLLNDPDFSEVLSQAQSKAQVDLSWVIKTGNALDHPVTMNFLEGRYLKAWMGILNL